MEEEEKLSYMIHYCVSTSKSYDVIMLKGFFFLKHHYLLFVCYYYLK